MGLLLTLAHRRGHHSLRLARVGIIAILAETSLSSEVRRLSDQLEEPRPVLVRESVTRPYDAYAFRTSAAVHDSAPGGTSTAFFSFRVSAMSSKDRLGSFSGIARILLRQP